jgi:hypothetical protein
MRIATGIVYAILGLGVAIAPASAKKTPDQTAKSQKASKTDQPATRSYKGDLVSANCAGNSGGAEAKNATVKNSGEADRSSGSQGCTVSSSTSEFALKTKDGRTLPFDLVGNLRTQDALKNNKKWASAASSGKPIEAKVSGIENNGRLTVLSVH